MGAVTPPPETGGGRANPAPISPADAVKNPEGMYVLLHNVYQVGDGCYQSCVVRTLHSYTIILVAMISHKSHKNVISQKEISKHPPFIHIGYSKAKHICNSK